MEEREGEGEPVMEDERAGLPLEVPLARELGAGGEVAAAVAVAVAASTLGG